MSTKINSILNPSDDSNQFNVFLIQPHKNYSFHPVAIYYYKYSKYFVISKVQF